MRDRGMTHTHNATAGLETTVLTVEGMSCGSCVRHVTRALEGMAGVTDVQVNLEAKAAVLEHRIDWPGQAAAVAAIRDAGYAAAVSDRNPSEVRGAAAGAKVGGCCCG